MLPLPLPLLPPTPPLRTRTAQFHEHGFLLGRRRVLMGHGYGRIELQPIGGGLRPWPSGEWPSQSSFSVVRAMGAMVDERE